MARSNSNTPTPTKRSSTARPNARPKPSAPERAQPVSAAEFEKALEALDIHAPFAVAVSGGADSLALLLLTAAWCRKCRLDPPHALTVDHGLRPESALEASRVAAWAGARAIPHHTLIWTGRKPTRNIQARAREARYRLLGDWLRAHGTKALLAGHTLDDQAETFLLRLSRGSGLDGLSGMAPLARYPLNEFPDLKLARPVLGFTHDSLIATLTQFGQPWIDDPSNQNDRFARIQIRRALQDLEHAGLTAQRIADATANLRRAREAIDAGVTALIASAVEIAPWGYALISSERFAVAPREVALRALSRLLEAFGGGEYPPRFDQSEVTLDWMAAPQAQPKGRTLGGCRLARRDPQTVLVTREEAALAKEDPVIRLAPGQTGLWDRRFAVTLEATAGAGTFEVRRLGPAGFKLLGAKPALPSVEPHRIAATVPALWQNGRLLAAPLFHPKAVKPSFSAHFIPLTRLTGS